MPDLWQAVYLERLAPGSGRTKPVIISCERTDGDGRLLRQPAIVKTMGHPEMSAEQLGFETLGYLAAQQFGCRTPEFGFVEISDEFINANASFYSDHAIKAQPGVGFGSFVVNNFSTIFPNTKLRDEDRPAAERAYALDLAIQNPDRRKAKTNCGRDSEGNLLLFDFEMGFSFCAPLVLLASDPWRVDRLKFHEDHVFFSSLKGQPVDWTWVPEAVASVNAALPTWLVDLPPGWCASSAKVQAHFAALHGNVKDFVSCISETLK